jgi:hypothetical protein
MREGGGEEGHVLPSPLAGTAPAWLLSFGPPLLRLISIVLLGGGAIFDLS